MTFYERFKLLCAEIGKTPTGVGAKLSIDRATINYWKNNHVPKTQALVKIANYFDVSIDYLLGNTDIRKNTQTLTGNEIAKVALFGGNTEVTDEIINQIADAALTESNKRIAENGVLNALQQKERELKKSINNLLKVAENAPQSKVIANRIAELEKELKSIQIRIIDEKKDVLILSKPLIVDWLSLFKNGDIEDENFRKQLITLFVNKITIYDDNDGGFTFEYIFNLTENAKRKYKKAVSDCSDLDIQWSPKETNPNIVITGFIFGYLKKHQLR